MCVSCVDDGWMAELVVNEHRLRFCKDCAINVLAVRPESRRQVVTSMQSKKLPRQTQGQEDRRA